MIIMNFPILTRLRPVVDRKSNQGPDFDVSAVFQSQRWTEGNVLCFCSLYQGIYSNTFLIWIHTQCTSVLCILLLCTVNFMDTVKNNSLFHLSILHMISFLHGCEAGFLIYCDTFIKNIIGKYAQVGNLGSGLRFHTLNISFKMAEMFL